MLWIDDLKHLDQDYLRRRFRPFEQGITAHQFNAVLSAARADTRDHVLTHVSDEVGRWAATAAPAPALGADDLFAAQSHMLAVYFWEIVYRRSPEVYELFSQCQDMPLDDLFPAELTTGATVVDVGTGTGRVAGFLASTAARIYGFDPSEPLLRIARAKYADLPHLSFDVGSFSHIPLPDGTADVVVSNFAYQPSEERGGRSGLAEMRRVLKPGGVALIAHANEKSEAFLRAEGLTERVARRPIIWRRPADSPALLDWLFRLSHVDFGDSREIERVRMRVFSFTA